MNDARTFLLPADREIIGNLLQGGVNKRRAEEQFFNRFAYFIQEGIKKYSFREEDAFDAYADAVLSAIDNILKGSFEAHSSLKTYLYQIFRHKCVDLLRKKATNKYSVHHTLSVTASLFNMSDAAKSVIQDLVDKADGVALKQKLDELGNNCRKALLMWAEGYNDLEIALSLEYKTADVAKTSRLRCLTKLKNLYKTR